MTSKYNNIKCKPQFVTVMQNRWKGQLVLESYYLDLFFSLTKYLNVFQKKQQVIHNILCIEIKQMSQLLQILCSCSK